MSEMMICPWCLSSLRKPSSAEVEALARRLRCVYQLSGFGNKNLDPHYTIGWEYIDAKQKDQWLEVAREAMKMRGVK